MLSSLLEKCFMGQLNQLDGPFCCILGVIFIPLIFYPIIYLTKPPSTFEFEVVDVDIYWIPTGKPRFSFRFVYLQFIINLALTRLKATPIGKRDGPNAEVPITQLSFYRDSVVLTADLEVVRSAGRGINI